jgi:hypothetical protein
MKTRFVVSPQRLDHLPRPLRVALRKEWYHAPAPKVQPAPRSNADVDASIRSWDAIDDPCGDSAYLSTNTVDPDFDIDGSVEFDDSTEEDNLHGLTIVEPGFGNIRRWLRGHDIL